MKGCSLHECNLTLKNVQSLLEAADHHQRHGEVDHGAHGTCTEHVPEIGAQEEEHDLPHDKLLLASLPASSASSSICVCSRREEEMPSSSCRGRGSWSWWSWSFMSSFETVVVVWSVVVVVVVVVVAVVPRDGCPELRSSTIPRSSTIATCEFLRFWSFTCSNCFI